MTIQAENDRERADLLQTLKRHRSFLHQTVQGLTDEQAAQRTTASELCLGGLIKHVAETEQRWVQFIVDGPAVFGEPDEAEMAAHDAGLRMLDGDTLTGLLHVYEEIASHTDQFVAALPSFDASQPLPVAPWFEPGASWSARRVLMHVIAETAQHSGHADIIRESLDGAKTMG